MLMKHVLTSVLAAASSKLDSKWKPNLAAKRTALITLSGSVKLQGLVNVLRNFNVQQCCYSDSAW